MKIKSNSRVNGALTLVEVLIVIATVFVLAVLLLMHPAHSGVKVRASRINCFSNLKQVGLGFRMWANDHEDKFPWLVSTNKGGTMELVSTGEAWRHYAAVSNELNSPKILACAADAQRDRTSTWTNFSNQNLTYFTGLDADEKKPSSILTGDRNVSLNGAAASSGIVLVTSANATEFTTAIHNQAGNIGLGDGSAQQVNSAALAKQLVASEQGGSPATNRFVIP